LIRERIEFAQATLQNDHAWTLFGRAKPRVLVAIDLRQIEFASRIASKTQ